MTEPCGQEETCGGLCSSTAQSCLSGEDAEERVQPTPCISKGVHPTASLGTHPRVQKPSWEFVFHLSSWSFPCISSCVVPWCSYGEEETLKWAPKHTHRV